MMSESGEVDSLSSISVMVVGAISSLAEGEFNTLVMGEELVSFSDEVDSLSSISVMLVGVNSCLAEGEFNTLVTGPGTSFIFG